MVGWVLGGWGFGVGGVGGGGGGGGVGGGGFEVEGGVLRSKPSSILFRTSRNVLSGVTYKGMLGVRRRL